jgi:hypothetical protein
MSGKIFFILCFLLSFCCVSEVVAQAKSKAAPDDVVRVDTRVVFVDVSVKDSKTNAPARDLSLKNFQVFDDDKPRELTYFSREGDTLLFKMNYANTFINFSDTPHFFVRSHNSRHWCKTNHLNQKRNEYD